MAKDNERFGNSPGPYVPIKGVDIPISLLYTGLNVEEGPIELDSSECVDVNAMRFIKGGIAPDSQFAPFPTDDVDTGAITPVLHITNFERDDKFQTVVRMRQGIWEWFDGLEWLAIPGSVAGLEDQRMYSTSIAGKLVVANGATRLQAWDGNPANAVADLSAEAPAAFYVVRVGNRLLAANLKFVLANDFNPNEVAWSADNNVVEWTDVVAGAGDAIILPEGGGGQANYITGLSNLERGTVMYRQRSLVLVNRTGVRASPFRFTTVDFSHGTESPYSIDHGGLKMGDFFLGYDFTVYLFDGQSEPVAIGLPIQRRLEDRVSNLQHCVGFVNPITMEYFLLSPGSGRSVPILTDLHAFSIRDYVRKQKLVWRYRDISSLSITAAAYAPRVASSFVPFVDSLNTVADRVDPTDPPIFVSSAEWVEPAPGDPPPEEGPVDVRTTMGAYGLNDNKDLWGFASDGSPKSPTPDDFNINTDGVSLVKKDGWLDFAKSVGARHMIRCTGGNQKLMVNYPTDRRLDLGKYKAFIDAFVAEVRSVQGGEAKLRAAVRERWFPGIMAWDDIRASGTSGNAFLTAPTFEEVEEGCFYLWSYWPWMPQLARAPGHSMKAKADAPAKGNAQFQNNGSRINGTRQYRYLTAAWSQYRPNSDKSMGSEADYVRIVNDAAEACGLGDMGGYNLCNNGKGTDPGWGCIKPTPTSTYDCAMSPGEIDKIGQAFLADERTFGIIVYAYNSCPDYYMRDEIWAANLAICLDALKRNEGPVGIRGTGGHWWGDLTQP